VLHQRASRPHRLGGRGAPPGAHVLTPAWSRAAVRPRSRSRSWPRGASFRGKGPMTQDRGRRGSWAHGPRRPSAPPSGARHYEEAAPS
jgi:hypothetical protein